MKKNWPEECLKYYNDHLEKEIKSNIDLVKNNKFTNINECMNFCFKLFFNFQKLPLDELLFELHRFMGDYLEQFDRASDEKVVGNYEFKPKYANLNYNFKYPYGFVNLKQKTKETTEEIRKMSKGPKEIKSQESVAKLVIENKLYQYCPIKKAFLITNPFNRSIFAVKIVN